MVNDVKCLLQLGVVYFCASLCLHKVMCSTRQDVQNLHDQLLQNYNRDLGPNSDQLQPIEISVSFNLFALQEFDDKYGKLVVLGLISISWRDDRMIWDPLKYGNTTSIVLPESKVWVPTIVIGQPYTNVERLGHDFISLIYSYEGIVRWDIPELFEVVCTANVAYYPIDRQICDIYVIPFSYEKGRFDFQLPFDKMTQEDFIENGIWKVQSTHMYKDDKVRDTVKMVIKFQRRPLYVLINLLLPVIVVCVLNIFIFTLPPEPGERSTFGMTIILSQAVFLSFISEQLPSTSEPHVARICIYLLSELVLSALSMVLALFGLRLYRTGENKPVPEWVKTLLIKCSKQRRNRNTNSEQIAFDQNHAGRQEAVGAQDIHLNHICIKPYGTHYGSYITRHGNSAMFEEQYRGVYYRENYKNLPIPKYPSSSGVSDEDNILTEHNTMSLTWTDVAKWFDKFCIVLFFFLNLIILTFQIVDAVIYLGEAF